MLFSSSPYQWTLHAQFKMRFYGLSESRVRRVIKSPFRIEEGIAPDTIAVMQPVSYKTKNGVKDWTQEIWVMYTIKNQKDGEEKVENQISPPKADAKGQRLYQRSSALIRIISAWRYPGKTKPQEALPEAIVDQIQEALSAL